jgi:hypothetical protein
MRRRNLARHLVAALLLAVVSVVAIGTSRSSAAGFEDFGIESVSATESTSEAGMHPDFTTRFDLNKSETEPTSAAGRVNSVRVFLPPGLLGNPNLVPPCSTGQFLALNCPQDSQVGIANINLSTAEEDKTSPLYVLKPANKEEVARLGFNKVGLPLFVDLNVRTAGDYGLTATVSGSPGDSSVNSVETIIWGNPTDPAHDAQRLTPFESLFCRTACLAPEGKRPSGLNHPIAFVSNPTACESQEVGFEITSYELPGRLFSATAGLPPIAECESLPFVPTLTVTPSSGAAGAPTGLSAVLTIPQTNSIEVPATSAMRDARVTLPEGMTLATNAADGLGACSESEVHLGEEVPSQCPEAAKLGSATFVSPDLPEALHGEIYQRTPAPGHLFRLWLVSDELGLHLKIPGEVVPDPKTGRLTAEFTETPQLPVEEIDLEFKGGPRAPLKNPASCGTYQTSYELTPWSGGSPVTGQSQMKISEGCGAGGFSPQLSAGVDRPVAGSYSPLSINLVRQDGEENISRFELTLPPGELAKLAGVPLCPESAASSAACPTASQIGTVSTATGVGTQPLWIPQPGKQATAVYLAGPYEGAPYSAIAKVPAQAGPFDLGTVVTRAGIYVDPETARATVKSDPLPQILAGVPILYRTIHIAVERPEFAIAPTSCEPMSIVSTVVSNGGHAAQPSDRFQVGECAALGFEPKLSLRLKGKARRGAYQQLTANLKTGENEANISSASVALPRSEFLAQNHIGTVCTRVQFAANQCPEKSIYGFAEAITPLLSEPLKGPVYLRSNGGERKLPDLVAALHGQLDITLVGFIDQAKKGGIRTRFQAVPDAPVSSFTLRMKGGAKSLIQNSTNICRNRQQATVKMVGHNGKVHDFEQPLGVSCGSSKKSKHS